MGGEGCSTSTASATATADETWFFLVPGFLFAPYSTIAPHMLDPSVPAST